MSDSSSGSSNDPVYATKEEFGADNKKLTGDRLEKRWQEYLKKHPKTGTGGTGTASSDKWYYPQYSSGAWAKLPTGQGNV